MKEDKKKPYISGWLAAGCWVSIYMKSIFCCCCFVLQPMIGAFRECREWNEFTYKFEFSVFRPNTQSFFIFIIKFLNVSCEQQQFVAVIAQYCVWRLKSSIKLRLFIFSVLYFSSSDFSFHGNKKNCKMYQLYKQQNMLGEFEWHC